MNKKRVLIVNGYFDELRIPFRRSHKTPQAMTPAFLAGLFSLERCDIKLYNEQCSGPLEDEALLAWPDMLVLTGLNTAFDRMLHLTAYARTRNKKVIVVAGGPAIRALFHHAQPFFDYRCDGDIEQLREVIEDAFGREYLSEQFLRDGWVIPRYDLTYWISWLGYVESSRNCYNRCRFCSLTAEKSRYQAYELEHLRRQFMALGKRKVVVFLDNNFGSVDKPFLADRFELLRELRQRGYFQYWCALVSNDFFLQDDHLRLSRETGCLSLFSGIETFDRRSLLHFNKIQNTLEPQLDMIRRCLGAGITFYYGMVFDLVKRSLAELRDEIDTILNNPAITLPSYISLAIPILGTPFFHECLKENLVLPNIKVRDLDGTTITLRPRDPLPEVIRFVKDLQHLVGFRKKVLHHSGRFFINYRHCLSYHHMVLALYNSLLLCASRIVTSRSEMGSLLNGGAGAGKRTFVGSTEPPDALYTPSLPVDLQYRHYFRPTMLTDHEGHLTEALRRDLATEKKIPPMSIQRPGVTMPNDLGSPSKENSVDKFPAGL